MKNNSKSWLFLISSTSDIIHIYPIKDYLKQSNFLSIIETSSYRVKSNFFDKIKVDVYRPPKIIKRKFLPYFIKILILILNYKTRLKKLIKDKDIKICILPSDKEPLFLATISTCKKLNVKTVVFQHGLYLKSIEVYEYKFYLNRFRTKIFYKIYKFFRYIVEFFNILPSRRQIGFGGADLYYFYSEYFKEMFVNDRISDKIKIVGPTRFDEYKKLSPPKKENIIIYAGCLINKWFPYLNIDDTTIFETIIKNLPDEFNLLIKPHPSENKDDYKKLINGTFLNRVKILNPEDDILEYLMKSKILITNGSSVIYDAIYFDNIVFLINSDTDINFDEDNLLLQISIDELPNLNISKIFNYKSLLLEKQRAFLNKHLNLNQNNSELFIKYLEELSK